MTAPVVIIGRQSVAESTAGVVGAAGAIRRALPDATFLVALRRGNVRGALDLGLAPGVLPGRVSLDAGRAWFEERWGKVPAATGLDTAGMLAAAADGRLQALVLLGADPLADFPDRELVRRALTSLGCVIAVDTFLTDSSRHATVVLAAAGYGEKEGTTTNIEGRVTGVARKVVAPGTAWDDWVIAAELARQLGGEFGFDSPEAVWDEIESVSAAHHGLTRALIQAPGRFDGVVVPPAHDPAAGAATLADAIAADPSAGVAPPTVVDGATGGVGLRIRAAVAPPSDAASAPYGPPLLVWTPPADLPPVPQLDAYSMRLVSGRTLYDRATSLAHTPHLAALAGQPTLAVNPFELERLGVAAGGLVRATSARTSLVLPVTADARLPHGSATLVFNLGDLGAADLIDATAAVTEVRVETT